MNLLEEVIPIVKEAGKAAMCFYEGDCKVERKADHSPVTEADLAADKVLQEKLARFGYPILSEETADDPARLTAERVWIIDPIDGTKDFIDHTGSFSVMVGLAENGRSLMGLVFLPTENKMYYAERGKGAFVQVGDEPPRPLKVSDIDDIKKARLVVSRSHISKAILDAAEKLGVADKIHCGSTGVKMCKVADGTADLFFTPTSAMSQWDVCAPHVIVEEAGGTVTGIDGREYTYNGEELKVAGGLAVSNGKLHQVILDEFRGHEPA